jgi:hypothetical protein
MATRRTRLKQLQSLGVILDSAEMEKHVAGLADAIKDAVDDPNPRFMATLRSRTFHTRSARGVSRVVGQVGAVPGLGDRVEAKRGPLARALGASRD